MISRAGFLVSLFGLLVLASTGAASVTVPRSQLDLQWQLAKAQFASGSDFDGAAFAMADTGSQKIHSGSATAPKPKSPTKAAILSVVLPGLGQYYNGSKIKAAAFLGLEATAWFLHFKLHADGNDLTNKFNLFQQEHWSRDHYAGYLYNVYGDSSDANLSEDNPEISHHLPSTPTQQYYEMTGKYDQFVWGWDDAALYDTTLSVWHGYTYYMDTTGSFIKVTNTNIPTSANRTAYENMRHDANKKFDNARAWLMVAMANRLVSAFEAYISARKTHNGGASGKKSSDDFSQWKFQAKLRSVYARYDTPYVKVTYKFF